MSRRSGGAGRRPAALPYLPSEKNEPAGDEDDGLVLDSGVDEVLEFEVKNSQPSGRQSGMPKRTILDSEDIRKLEGLGAAIDAVDQSRGSIHGMTDVTGLWTVETEWRKQPESNRPTQISNKQQRDYITALEKDI